MVRKVSAFAIGIAVSVFGALVVRFLTGDVRQDSPAAKAWRNLKVIASG